MDPERSRFYSLMAGMGTRRLQEESLLHLAGFSAHAMPGAHEDGELWQDPADPSKDGGLWVGREEALRRIRVRQAQGLLVIYPDNARPPHERPPEDEDGDC